MGSDQVDSRALSFLWARSGGVLRKRSTARPAGDSFRAQGQLSGWKRYGTLLGCRRIKRALVLVNDGQVESGIYEALARVKSEGVLIEGNSFLDYVTPDLAIMCARSDGGKVKPSARHALKKSDVLYLSSLAGDGVDARKQFDEWRTSLNIELDLDGLPILTREDLPPCHTRVHQTLQKKEPSI